MFTAPKVQGSLSPGLLSPGFRVHCPQGYCPQGSGFTVPRAWHWLHGCLCDCLLVSCYRTDSMQYIVFWWSHGMWIHGMWSRHKSLSHYYTHTCTHMYSHVLTCTHMYTCTHVHTYIRSCHCLTVLFLMERRQKAVTCTTSWRIVVPPPTFRCNLARPATCWSQGGVMSSLRMRGSSESPCSVTTVTA